MAIDFTELNQKLQDEEKELWERLQTVTQLRTSLKAVFGDAVPASLPAGTPANTTIPKTVSSGAPVIESPKVAMPDSPTLPHMRRSPVAAGKMPTSELIVYVLKRVGHPLPSAAIAAEIWADTRIPNKPSTENGVKMRVQSCVHTLHKAKLVEKGPFGWALTRDGKNGSL